MIYLITYTSGDVSGHYDELYIIEGHFKTFDELIKYTKLLDIDLTIIGSQPKYRWIEYPGDNYRFDSIYIFDDNISSPPILSGGLDIVTNKDLEKLVSDYKSNLREDKLNELGIK